MIRKRTHEWELYDDRLNEIACVKCGLRRGIE